MGKTAFTGIHFLRRLKYGVLNRPKIKSKDIKIGKNVIFGKNVRLEAKSIRIGDGCVIMDNTRIKGNSFEIGDYGTIYQNCFFPGGDVKIGNNFWLGADSIVDGCAGTTIGDNVGIGAQSQLWTHMVYGDVMNGCRFHNQYPLEIGNDVWLCGHNLVSPVKIKEGSLAMLGSLITRDIEEHRTYAGSPAKDMTEKLGPQFEEISLGRKKEILMERLESIRSKYGFDAVEEWCEIIEESGREFTNANKFQINIVDRTYRKQGSIMEYYIMMNLLPDVKLQPK